MRKTVLKHNRKQHILAIATGFFAALPVICLPIGLREGMTPAMAVSRAYESVFGKQTIKTGEVVIEEWALVSSTDQLVSAEYNEDVEPADPVETTNPTEYNEVSTPTSYKDIPKYVVYQAYDSSNIPIELLDPEYFAPDNTTFYVRAGQSILKDTPHMESLTIARLHVGQQVTRTGVGDTWSRILTESGDEGYVLTSAIQDTMISVAIERTVWVDSDGLIIRSEPSTNADQIAVAGLHQKLYCSAIVGDKWYKVTTTGGTTGYVYKSYTTTNPPPTPTPTPSPYPRSDGGGGGGGGGQSYGNPRTLPKITGCNGASIVSIAESMLGVPYVFAGSDSSGIDCSGLVMYCYAQVGVYVPHGATQIYLHSGVSVPREDLKAGDVICYDYGSYCGHVAIYVGDGTVIHASSTRGQVVYGSLDMMSIKAIKRIIQ